MSSGCALRAYARLPPQSGNKIKRQAANSPPPKGGKIGQTERIDGYMAKKKASASEKTGLDMGKGFATNAFSGLKTLQAMRKSEDEDKRAAREIEEARARARASARAREESEAKRPLRFAEEDLTDASGLSDEEIFAACMAQMDGADIYDKKFSAKETPKTPASHQDGDMPHLSLSDEEKEFAIFTQEMAISNVQRLTKPAKPAHKTRNKGKYLQKAEDLAEKDIVKIDARPAVAESGMRTTYVAPAVAVTQIEKGCDVVEEPDLAAGMTARQKQLLHSVKRHEVRCGPAIALRLRGLALNAALSRFDAFIDACIAEKKPYALIICGKGLGSDGAPVIKEGVIARCKSDPRIAEYAPAVNGDGDFGSLYVALCVSGQSAV